MLERNVKMQSENKRVVSVEERSGLQKYDWKQKEVVQELLTSREARCLKASTVMLARKRDEAFVNNIWNRESIKSGQNKTKKLDGWTIKHKQLLLIKKKKKNLKKRGLFRVMNL